MFAVIADGGQQYRVEEGDTVTIAYRDGAEQGAKLQFDRVLLANAGGESAVGRPHIDGATVEAEVISPEVKGNKIDVQRFRRRKNSRRHTGHRQLYTQVRVTTITVPGLEVAQEPPASDEPAGKA